VKEDKPWKYVIAIIAGLVVAVALHWYLSDWLCPPRGCRPRRDFLVNFFLVWMPSMVTFICVCGVTAMLLDTQESPAAPAEAEAPAAPAGDRDPAGNAYDRGVEHLERGEYEAAVREFGAAIALDGRYVNAYICRAHAFAELGHYDHAQADYDAAIRLDPRNDIAFQSRGRLWHDIGELNRAVADYDEALRLRPDYILALYGRAMAYRDRGNTQEAVADLRHALALNPDDATRSRLQNRLAEFGAPA
jgi:tetratricopeptide (TPR) repeat protein